MKKFFERIPVGRTREELLHNKINIYLDIALEGIRAGENADEVFQELRKDLHEAAEHYIEITGIIYKSANNAPQAIKN